MAKKTVATLQKGTSSLTKVIKMVKSPKSGSYMFKEEIIDKANAKDWLNKS